MILYSLLNLNIRINIKNTENSAILFPRFPTFYNCPLHPAYRCPICHRKKLRNGFKMIKFY